MKLNNNDDSHNSGLNLLIYNMLLDIGSHPAWVCGLKLIHIFINYTLSGSHPAWVCGLKPMLDWNLTGQAPSHPAWVCGLKHGQIRPSTCGSQCHTLRGCVDWNIYHLTTITTAKWSHPAWVCGLKLVIVRLCRNVRVTPCVGVWIETNSYCDSVVKPLSHTLRGCVDWNLNLTVKRHCALKSHPAWVCGLKLAGSFRRNKNSTSHPAWVCGLKPVLMINIIRPE